MVRLSLCKIQKVKIGPIIVFVKFQKVKMIQDIAFVKFQKVKIGQVRAFVKFQEKVFSLALALNKLKEVHEQTGNGSECFGATHGWAAASKIGLDQGHLKKNQTVFLYLTTARLRNVIPRMHNATNSCQRSLKCEPFKTTMRSIRIK